MFGGITFVLYSAKEGGLVPRVQIKTYYPHFISRPGVIKSYRSRILRETAESVEKYNHVQFH